MSRMIVAIAIAAFAAAPAAATPTCSVEARAESSLGLSMGIEAVGHSLGLGGVVVEYAFTEQLRLHTGVNVGLVGLALPVAVGWTPMGNAGATPVLEAGATVYRVWGMCGGGPDCGEASYTAAPHAAVGVAWFGDDLWIKAQVVAHVFGGDHGVLPLPGLAGGWTF